MVSIEMAIVIFVIGFIVGTISNLIATSRHIEKCYQIMDRKYCKALDFIDDFLMEIELKTKRIDFDLFENVEGSFADENE